ncbi:MAG: hypothetical protein FJ005_08705 [Chloroflexi bacterium]|nr:hypothetical protein [Chloroflexota bacterium]
MKTSRRFLVLCKGMLAVFLAACLLGLVIYAVGGHSRGTNSSKLSLESMSTVEQQAWQLAREVVGASRDAQEQFVTELLALYAEVKDSDLAIFCNPGGWGKEPLSSDYQGRSCLAGIETSLTKMGYKYYRIEDIRTGSSLVEYLYEFKEHLTHYPSKAKELATKIDFLTQQVAGLKIMIIGQSSGAAFASEVASYLEDNPEVYSIQVGRPFWYRGLQVGQSLVIDSNGIGADAVTERDLVALFKTNWARLFIMNHVPSFTPFDWVITRAVLIFGPSKYGFGLRAPGHEYMWEYPGVGPVIEAFLVKNFGTQ